MQRCTYQAVLFTPPQRCAKARRHETRSRLPRLRGYAYALHTNTDNVPPVQLLAGGCNIAELGATRGHPPSSPQPRLGVRAGYNHWDCAPLGGGGA